MLSNSLDPQYVPMHVPAQEAKMNQASRTDRKRLGQFTPLATLPTLPDDLTSLSDEDLGTLCGELEAYHTEAQTAVTSMADVEALGPIVDAIVRLRELAAERMTPAPTAEDVAAALAAQGAQLSTPAPTEPVVTPPAPAPAAPAAPAPAPTGTEPAPSTEPAPTEPVVAALPALPTNEPAEPTRVTGVRDRSRREFAEPVALRPDATITAAGDVPGFAMGQELESMHDVAVAMIERRRSIGNSGPAQGNDQVVVASVHADYPDERHLRHGDTWQAQMEKVNELAGPEAITAAGGLCAPVQPYYDVMTIAEATRPVRDALTGFQADRGGIRLIPPPQLVDAAGSIGFITAAVDAAALGGSGGQISAATKPCLHVTCPGVVEYDVAAVTRCLEFGNITARAYPEQVTAWMTLATAQWARKAETALLDVIAAHSTQVTLAATAGAARDIISGIVKAAAYYRNHNRMSVDKVLRCMLPGWVIDLMIVDLTKGSGYEAEYFTMARQTIRDALAEVNVNVSFYLDSGTGKGQLFNSGNVQTAGALVAFPTTVVWYLFSEGSFLFLDMGQLDFGVVRDSTLNSLNNYRVFAETFETAAFVGVESLEGTQTVVANGTFAGPAYGSTTVSAPIAIPSTY